MSSSLPSPPIFQDQSEAAAPASKPGPGRLAGLLFSDAVLIAFLIGINLFCFSRTLTGYFLADDFVHIPYLYKVFHGHPELLWQNFYTNWMQAQGTQFYRPLISITLALDYLLWGVNATGYHITNFLFQCAATVFLFLLVRRLLSDSDTAMAGQAGDERLTREQAVEQAEEPAEELAKVQAKVHKNREKKHEREKRARWVAFSAAALFAANPLHAEVVSWIIARVDSVCCAFLLLSFWLYLRARSGKSGKSTRLASLTAFVLALLSKEMAITLPPTLLFLELSRPFLNGAAGSANWKKVAGSAVRSTWVYWAVLAVYLIVRTLSLGTVAGGYAGSIGHGLSDSLFKRWFEDGSLGRVFFPLNVFLPSTYNWLRRALRLLYQIGGVMLVFRLYLLFRAKSLTPYLSQVFFSVGWFVVCMAPTYQVWNLTESLQGSRFIYLGSAPLALFMALLLAPLVSPYSDRDSDRYRGFYGAFNLAQAVLIVFFTATFAQIALADNMQWGRASAALRSFKREVESELDRLPENKVMVVLNIPQRFEGAHMLYNAATMSVLFSPPLAGKNYFNRLATFEPVEFGDADLINAARLQRYLSQADRFSYYRWLPASRHLVPLRLMASRQQLTVPGPVLSAPASDDIALASPPLSISSCATAFVDVTLKGRPAQASGAGSVLTMMWNASGFPVFEKERLLNLAVADLDLQTVRFFVGQRKSWVMCESICQLAFKVPKGQSIESVALKNGDDEIASLAPQAEKLNSSGGTMREDLSGISRPGKSVGLFSYDVTKIHGARRALLEVSQPDSWFEHYSGQFNDSERSEHALLSQPLNDLQGRDRAIDASLLGQPGFYELRVAALDDDKKVVGCFSYPIDIQLSALDVAKAGREK